MPAAAEARGFAVRVGPTVGMRPFFNAPHGLMRPRAFPNARFGFRPGFAGGFRGGRGRFGRFGRGYGFGGFGGAGLGLGMMDSDLLVPPGDGYGGPPGPEPVAYPPPPPPCVRPMIITVGKGLRRPAKTRVVYGSPSPCGY